MTTVSWWQSLILAFVFSGVSTPAFYVFSKWRGTFQFVFCLNVVLWLLFAIVSRLFLLISLN